MDTHSCCWSNLPKDVLECIGLYLPLCALQNARLVCSHWHKHIAARADGVGQMLEIDMLPTIMDWRNKLKYLKLALPNQKDYMVYCSSRLEKPILESGFESISEILTHVTRIEVRFAMPGLPSLGKRPEGLPAPMGLLTNLRSLWIIAPGLTSESALHPLTSLTGLRNFKLLTLDSHAMSQPEQVKVLAALTQLTSMELSLMDLDDTSAGMSHLTTLTQLQQLKLQTNTPLSQATLLALSTLPQLQDLDIAPQADPQVLLELLMRPGATALHLHLECPSTSPFNMPVSALRRTLSRMGDHELKRLTGLRLMDIVIDSPNLLQMLAQLTCLRELEISQAYGPVNLDGDLLLLTSLTALTALTIAQMPSELNPALCFTPRSVPLLAAAWPCLNLLSIWNCGMGQEASKHLGSFKVLEVLYLQPGGADLEVPADVAWLPELSITSLPTTLISLHVRDMKIVIPPATKALQPQVTSPTSHRVHDPRATNMSPGTLNTSQPHEFDAEHDFNAVRSNHSSVTHRADHGEAVAAASANGTGDLPSSGTEDICSSLGVNHPIMAPSPGGISVRHVDDASETAIIEQGSSIGTDLNANCSLSTASYYSTESPAMSTLADEAAATYSDGCSVRDMVLTLARCTVEDCCENGNSSVTGEVAKSAAKDVLESHPYGVCESNLEHSMTHCTVEDCCDNGHSCSIDRAAASRGASTAAATDIAAASQMSGLCGKDLVQCLTHCKADRCCKGGNSCSSGIDAGHHGPVAPATVTSAISHSSGSCERDLIQLGQHGLNRCSSGLDAGAHSDFATAEKHTNNSESNLHRATDCQAQLLATGYCSIRQIDNPLGTVQHTSVIVSSLNSELCSSSEVTAPYSAQATHEEGLPSALTCCGSRQSKDSLSWLGSLEDLSLLHCIMDADSLGGLFARITGLRSLELHQVDGFNEGWVSSLASLTCLTSLRLLDMESEQGLEPPASYVSQASLSHLHPLRKLRHLEWITSRAAPESPEHIRCLSALTSLHTLVLPQPESANVRKAYLDTVSSCMKLCDMEDMMDFTF